MADIMIVDDSKFMRKMLSDILIEAGHQIVGEAENAAEAAIAAADYITDHHDADGAAHAIRRIILEGRPPRKKVGKE